MKRLIPLVAAIVINVALIAGFAALTHTPPGGPDVVDLQLAMSPGVFKQIVDLWGPETVAAARRRHFEVASKRLRMCAAQGKSVDLCALGD